MIKQALFTTLIALSFGNAFSNTQTIGLDEGYCNGEFTIQNVNSSHFENMEKIDFSNGIQITFFGGHSGEAMHISGNGGFFVSDSVSKLFFKKEEMSGLEKSGKVQDHWQFAINQNRGDSLWNNSLIIPNNPLAPDTFAYEENSSIKLSQASFFFGFSGPEMPVQFPYKHEYMFSNHKSIAYLQGVNSRNIKLQISKYSISHFTSGPENDDNSAITYVTFKWAADSAGNGKFLHDGTAIENGNTNSLVSTLKQAPISIKKQGSSICISNKSLNSSNISIYNLKGRQIYSFNLNSHQQSKILSISSGIYLSRIQTSDNIYTKRFSVK